MQWLLGLLIVAAGPPAATDAGFADAVEVFHCALGRASDSNFDDWPDGWIRRRGAGFPHYVDVKIVDDPSPVAASCLRVDLNGGAASLDSPPVPVGALFSYVLECYIKTSGLKHDEAVLTVSFFNGKRELLETFESQRIGGTSDWNRVSLGPLTPTHADADYAQIGLHLRPTEAGVDLRGKAWFDDVRVARIPRVTLDSNRRDNIFVDPARPEVRCQVSGFLDHEPVISFELVDVDGKSLARTDRRVVRDAAGPIAKPSGSSGTTPKESPALAGSVTWAPPIPGPGFYRVRATMAGADSAVHRREITLVMVHPEPAPRSGEFGWTLPKGDRPLPLGDLIDVVMQAGINWVKLPVWYGPQEMQRVDRLGWFAERLNSQGIDFVGILGQPPAEIRAQLGGTEDLTAAGIFSSDPKLWYPSLEPIVTPLSLKVRWWQLGDDNDTSFVGYPDLPQKIAEIKERLSHFGQKVNLGLGWRWVNSLPADEQPPWSFLTLSAQPALTAEELETHLATTSSEHTHRWVVIEPLARSEYKLEDRAADLVFRMMAAKMQKADGIFVPDPFGAEHGLMNDDGTAGELLLPWRTTALSLAGAEYLGSLQLPGGSQNRVFLQNGKTTLVVWNDTPKHERFYLGEDVQQMDVWGRKTTPEQEGGQQGIDVGPVPTFITGLNEPIVRLQLGFDFSNSQLPSVFGVPQPNGFTVKNCFRQGISGRVRLVTPDVWRTVPKDLTIKLAIGETLTQPFEVTLPYDASSGRQNVRVDFDISADRRYQFSVYRQINVGVDDVTIEVSTRLNAAGDLEVEQRLTNATDDPVSFKCQLFAPDRRRMVTQVLDQSRGTDKRLYRLPEGKELVGKTLWLRAEEIGGQRILNYRVLVQE